MIERFSVADVLLGGYLHIFRQIGFIMLGVAALFVAKLAKPPRRRLTHMILGVTYTSGLIIGFVWGVLSTALLFNRMLFQTAHGFVAIIIIAIIVTGASLGFPIHFLKRQLFKIHFIAQFTGSLLALTQIVL